MFAAVGETYGFVGAAVVLSLYALLIWRTLRILTMSKNLYGTLIAGGILAMLMFQVFVNVGMTIGIMPITGVPVTAAELWRLVGDRHVHRHRPAAVDLRPGTDRVGWQRTGRYFRNASAHARSSARPQISKGLNDN